MCLDSLDYNDDDNNRRNDRIDDFEHQEPHITTFSAPRKPSSKLYWHNRYNWTVDDEFYYGAMCGGGGHTLERIDSAMDAWVGECTCADANTDGEEEKETVRSNSDDEEEAIRSSNDSLMESDSRDCDDERAVKIGSEHLGGRKGSFTCTASSTTTSSSTSARTTSASNRPPTANRTSRKKSFFFKLRAFLLKMKANHLLDSRHSTRMRK